MTEKTKWELYKEKKQADLQGRMVYSTSLNGVSGTQNVSVPVKEFSKGSYIVNVTSMGVTKTQHVVIK